MRRNSSPPRLFIRLFRWFCDESMHPYIEGDLIELYKERLSNYGKTRADLRFIIDVLLLFRPGIIRPLFTNQNTTSMSIYKNYITIGWRNLLRNKGYSLINIGGLAAGMSVAILIGLWIYDELSFNKYHDNYNRIAQVYCKKNQGGETYVNTALVTGLGTLLKNEYGNHFERVAMVRARTEERVLANVEKKFTEMGFFIQPEGPAMLSLRMKHGTIDGLRDMNSILLSSTVAQKLFGDADPVGQTISMDAAWDLKVTGVYEDIPKNSHFHEASYFATLDRYLNGWASIDAWDNYHMYIYVQLKQGAELEQINAVVKDSMLDHIGKETAEEEKPEVFLHPMNRWHLYSEWENGFPVMSKNLVAVWYYGAIGVFVLLLACINFMNLSTARCEKRAKEVGIRKSIGSLRSQLVQQFYGESFMVSVFAFCIAMAIVQLSLPWFNSVSGKSISIPVDEVIFWLMTFTFVFVTGLLAGIYPAIYLSSFSPVKVLKGTFKTGKRGATPRRVLVVVQFSVSILLTIGTIIVYQQLQYAKNRPVGYDRSSLIGLRAASPDFRGKYEVLRNELKNTGAVIDIAEANYPITDTRGWNPGFSWGEKVYEPAFNTIFVSYDYGKTIGWEFLEGRDFSREFASDTAGIVINESAAKIFGIKDPVGEYLKWSPGRDRGTFRIVGVVKDMVKGSPYDVTYPSVIFLSRDDMQWLYIRLNPAVSTHDALGKIEKVFARLVPSAPFDYTFADEAYAAKFAAEERIGKLASLFSALAIVISCLGLFGLAAFTVEQRTKEIGIRKVLGATVANLWQMLSKEFIMLVLTACVIAVPLGYYFMNTWLQQFVYRMPLRWEVFAISCLGGIVITIVTVSFQAIKAAVANPVSSLRSE
ncbi:MAG TPA: ABC transporter permease [Chryseosolibacter sp.]